MEYGNLCSIFEDICRGSSVVERSPEEAGVGGSIPSRGTVQKIKTPTSNVGVFISKKD